MPISSNAFGTDPYQGFRFWVEVGGTGLQTAGFTECSGFTIETQTEEYPEGGLNSFVHKLPIRTKYTNLVLKRGIDLTLDLYNWYMQVASGHIERRQISIVLYENALKPGHDRKIVYRWDFREAFPCKWTAPEFHIDQGSVAVETLEIAHHGLLPTSGRAR